MSQPVELFEFKSATTTYRYTSAAESISTGLGPFEPIGIGRGDVSASHEDGQNVVTIQVARNNPVALLHRDLPPDTPVRVTIYRMVRGGSAPAPWWHGIVSGVRWEGAVATLECDTLLRAADRPGPRLRFQSQCRWPLYSRGCGVDKEAFKDVGPITAINSTLRLVQVRLPVQRAARWFRGGWLELGGRRLLITGNSGGFVVGADYEHRLDLAYWAPELAVGAVSSVYAGCSHQRGDCYEKFSNAENFGGFDRLPDDNIFEIKIG